MTTTVGFIPLQLIPANVTTMDRLPANGAYVVVKTPTVAQQIQFSKSLKEGKEPSTNTSSKPVILRCKRRVDFTGIGCKLVDSQNPSVARRNERERRRVKMVNLGFETLRQHVPNGRKNKKMSKVETLRSAVQYIKQLQEMLDSQDSSSQLSDILSPAMLEEHQEAMKTILNSVSNAANSTTTTSISVSPTECGVKSGQSDIQNSFHQMETSPYQQQENYSPYHHHPNSSPYPQHHPQQQHQDSPYHQTDCYSQTSGDSGNYSHASPGSLHSPTPSTSSDASYDSLSQEEEDLLGFTSWFG